MDSASSRLKTDQQRRRPSERLVCNPGETLSLSLERRRGNKGKRSFILSVLLLVSARCQQRAESGLAHTLHDDSDLVITV